MAQCLRGPSGETGGGELQAVKQGEGVVGLRLVQVLWRLLQTQPHQVPKAAAEHAPDDCERERIALGESTIYSSQELAVK